MRPRSRGFSTPTQSSDVRPSRWTLLWLALALAIIAGVAIGTLRLSVIDVVRGMLGTGEAMPVAVVRTLRLPRVLQIGRAHV